MANNCKKCDYLHDNGNCTAVGGFCTSVPAAKCKLLKEYLDTGFTPTEHRMLSCASETLKFEEEKLDALRKIQQKVSSTYVEKVVRCRDCSYWNMEMSIGRESLGTYSCPCNVWSITEEAAYQYTNPNDYCSYGVRNDEEDG